MKRSIVIFFVLTLMLTACGGGNPAQESKTEATSLPTVPAEYADKVNLMAGNEDAIAFGGKIFYRNCSSCHGEEGKGDGPASGGLSPKPANLSDPELNDSMSDAFIYWRIAEGGIGAPFNSLMPAWKNLLTEDEIWHVVSFIRTLK